VGSVGKLVVALALFQALADAWPDDLERRATVLRDTTVTADAFSQSDHHTVRFFDPATKTLARRTIRVGDKGSLLRVPRLDAVPSSNSAAGMVMREAMLLRQFGKAYPVGEDEIRRFFSETRKSELTALFERTFVEPVTRNGLDVNLLRQGSLFTHQGKRIVPARARATARPASSRATSSSSSRAASSTRSRAARSSGSSTSPSAASATPRRPPSRPRRCSSSPDRCTSASRSRAFAASRTRERQELHDSVAIVEHPAGGRRLYYMVTIVSNVLRRNSASVHMELATRLQKLLESLHQAPPAADR